MWISCPPPLDREHAICWACGISIELIKGAVEALASKGPAFVTDESSTTRPFPDSGAGLYAILDSRTSSSKSCACGEKVERLLAHGLLPGSKMTSPELSVILTSARSKFREQRARGRERSASLNLASTCGSSPLHSIPATIGFGGGNQQRCIERHRKTKMVPNA